MFRRPSLGSIVTTMTAATVLVGGADLASYAATGHPLVLGHANSAVGTTSLKNVGRGPALSLDSTKSSSPLTVNSSTLVKHLNANSVPGMTARKLEPRTIRFHLGAPGVTFAGSTVHIFTAKVPRGTYQIGMTGTDHRRVIARRRLHVPPRRQDAPGGAPSHARSTAVLRLRR